VKNDDVMNLIAVFCILFVFMLVLYCFCGATEFSVNKDLYISREKVKNKKSNQGRFKPRSAHGVFNELEMSRTPSLTIPRFGLLQTVTRWR